MNIAWAAQSGDSEKLRDFLQLGVSPMVAIPAPGSLLITAAFWARVECAECLLDAGVPVNVRDGEGMSPLLSVAGSQTNRPEVEKVRMIRLLVERGADVSARDTDGWSALMLAHERELGPAIESLLRDVGVPDAGLPQARLNRALAHHDSIAIRQAVADGADVHLRSRWRGSSIHRTWIPDIVRLLLELGADINARDAHGNTALYNAATREEWEWEEGCAAFVQFLLGCGADLNCDDTGGARMVAFAMDEGLDDIVQVLVGAGADEQRGRQIYTQQLADRKAALKATSRREPGILATVLERDRFDLAEQHVTGGTNPDGPMYNEITPIMWLAGKGKARAVEWLLKRGVNATRITALGESAIKNAAVAGHADVVRLLLQHGVSTETLDAQTAAKWARAAGHGLVAQMFGAAS